MKSVRHGTAWVLAIVGGMCLGAGAISWSQSKGGAPPAVLKTPNDLSQAFRQAAHETLPAVVSIMSKTKGGVAVAGDHADDEGGQSPFGDDDLFRQFFGDRFQGRVPGQQFRRYVPPQLATGSGVIINDSGVILTNSHVVATADEVTVKLQSGEEYRAKSWATDPRRDIAIVKIEAGHSLPVAPLGDSDQMDIGDWVLALGNPFNVGTSVTAGIVSATGREMNITELESFIQTDAAVNPGNSGGPLINLNGEVIGINTAISTNSGGYDGVSFAIPINMVRGIATQLSETGKVQRSYLGVGLQRMTRDLREWYKAPDGGALVSLVKPDTPAAKAGVQVGDIIVEFAGKPINQSAALTSLVEGLPAGKEQTMVVLRKGEKVTLQVTPEEMPGDYTDALKRMKVTHGGEAAAEEKNVLGLQVTELTPDLHKQLTEQLSFPADGAGVLVKGVDVGSAAYEAGVRRMDVITNVDNEAVTTPQDFETAVKSADAKKGVLLRVARGDNVVMVLVHPEE